MKVKCIEGFLVDLCDDDGFTIEESGSYVRQGSIWEIDDDKNKVLNGEVRLIKYEEVAFSWLEIPKEMLDKNFKIVE